MNYSKNTNQLLTKLYGIHCTNVYLELPYLELLLEHWTTLHELFSDLDKAYLVTITCHQTHYKPTFMTTDSTNDISKCTQNTGKHWSPPVADAGGLQFSQVLWESSPRFRIRFKFIQKRNWSVSNRGHLIREKLSSGVGNAGTVFGDNSMVPGGITYLQRSVKIIIIKKKKSELKLGIWNT